MLPHFGMDLTGIGLDNVGNAAWASVEDLEAFIVEISSAQHAIPFQVEIGNPLIMNNDIAISIPMCPKRVRRVLVGV